jgi:hypothetical protein
MSSGVQAASQLRFIGWLPGDEFEAARKKPNRERNRSETAKAQGEAAETVDHGTCTPPG